MNKFDVLLGIFVVVVLIGFICMVTVGTVYEDCVIVDKSYKNDPIFDDFHIVIEYEGEKETIGLAYENWLKYDVGDMYPKTIVLPLNEWW